MRTMILDILKTDALILRLDIDFCEWLCLGLLHVRKSTTYNE